MLARVRAFREASAIHRLRLIRKTATPAMTIAPMIPPMIGSSGRFELPVGGALVEPTVSDTVVR